MNPLQHPASRVALLALLLIAVPCVAPIAEAQTGRGVTAPATAPSGLDERRAEDVRNELRELMRQYPPALGRVLRLDSGLMASPGYLAPYPALAAFIQAHPEVARYPDYFLNFVNESSWSEPLDPASRVRIEALNAQRNFFESLLIVAAISAVAFAVVWLVRVFVGHRRWLRVTRLQSDMNNRLLERLGSNEQLLAYLQSHTGNQLMTMPAHDPSMAATTSPFGRILWAVQAALVLVSAGIGLLVIKRYVSEEAGFALLACGVLAVAIGIGFGLASAASYVLSQRFGLFAGARNGQGDTDRP